MVITNLPTNFQDDELNTETNVRRRYTMIDNGDGTVSFEDVTDYVQEGTSFGASSVNATNGQTNNNTQNLGTTEYSALSAYTKGSFFALNGQRCEALQDISAGAELVLNTNYAVRSVDSSIGLLNTDLTHIKLFIDTSKALYNGTSTYTCTQDCYFMFIGTSSSSGSCTCSLNGVNIQASTSGGGVSAHMASGFAKEGDVLKASGGRLRIYGLR